MDAVAGSVGDLWLTLQMIFLCISLYLIVMSTHSVGYSLLDAEWDLQKSLFHVLRKD